MSDNATDAEAAYWDHIINNPDDPDVIAWREKSLKYLVLRGDLGVKREDIKNSDNVEGWNLEELKKLTKKLTEETK